MPCLSKIPGKSRSGSGSGSYYGNVVDGGITTNKEGNITQESATNDRSVVNSNVDTVYNNLKNTVKTAMGRQNAISYITKQYQSGNISADDVTSLTSKLGLD